jgi:hypothetical protein
VPFELAGAVLEEEGGLERWARLLPLLDETMLLADRGFDSGDFLAAAESVAATRAQFLVRLNASRRPPVLRHLPDGSFLSIKGDIGRVVLARLCEPRRSRVCARKVKSPLSRWNKHRRTLTTRHWS